MNIRRHLALAATPCLALSLLAAAPASAETTAPLWHAQMCASSDAAYDPAAMTLMDTRAVEATSSTGMKLVITSLTYDLGMGGRWCDLVLLTAPEATATTFRVSGMSGDWYLFSDNYYDDNPANGPLKLHEAHRSLSPGGLNRDWTMNSIGQRIDTPVGTSVIGAGSYLRHQTGRVASGHVWMDSTWYHEWALRVRSESGTTAIVTPDAAAVAAAKKVYQTKRTNLGRCYDTWVNAAKKVRTRAFKKTKSLSPAKSKAARRAARKTFRVAITDAKSLRTGALGYMREDLQRAITPQSVTTWVKADLLTFTGGVTPPRP